MLKAHVWFTPKRTLTDEVLFLTFHILMLSFHHVFNCGLASDSNISSVLFQYNHSVDLKYLKIALVVFLIFLRLPTVGSRNCSFISFHSGSWISERAGQNSLFLWSSNNLKVLLLGGCMAVWHHSALSAFPSGLLFHYFLEVLFSPFLTWSFEVQPRFTAFVQKPQPTWRFASLYL